MERCEIICSKQRSSNCQHCAKLRSAGSTMPRSPSPVPCHFTPPRLVEDTKAKARPPFSSPATHAYNFDGSNDEPSLRLLSHSATSDNLSTMMSMRRSRNTTQRHGKSSLGRCPSGTREHKKKEAVSYSKVSIHARPAKLKILNELFILPFHRTSCSTPAGMIG